MSAGGAATKPQPCRSERCKMPLLWMKTARGNKMPLDAEPAFKVGEMAPVDLGGLFFLDGDTALAARDVAGRPCVVPLYRSHFVTCPERDKWRRPRPSASGKT